MESEFTFWSAIAIAVVIAGAAAVLGVDIASSGIADGGLR